MSIYTRLNTIVKSHNTVQMDSNTWFQNYRQKVVDHETASRTPDHNPDDACVWCWYPPVPVTVMDLWFKTVMPVVELFIVKTRHAHDNGEIGNAIKDLTLLSRITVVCPENTTTYKTYNVNSYMYDLTSSYITADDWNFTEDDDWYYQTWMEGNVIYVDKIARTGSDHESDRCDE